MNCHPQQMLTPPGSDEPVGIDTALVPLIQALWAAGFATITCCQDHGEAVGGLNPRKAACWKGRVLLELPARDARRLAEVAAAHRFPMHWADDDAWEMSAPVIMLGARAVLTDFVQVHFPAHHLDGLVLLVRALRKRG